MENVQGLLDVVCEVLGRIVILQAEGESPEAHESPHLLPTKQDCVLFWLLFFFCISVRVGKIETQDLSLGALATMLELTMALRKGSFLLPRARGNSELI